MADVKTFSNFKDWLLIALLSIMSWLAGSTYIKVSHLATKDVVRDAIQVEKEKVQAKLESDVIGLKRDQERQDARLDKMEDYIKPKEVRNEITVER